MDPVIGSTGGLVTKKCGMKLSTYYFACGLHLCTCFFFVFTAFSAIQSQSTSQFGLKLGIASTATLYLAFAIFSLIGPFIFKVLKARWTLVIGLIGYMFLAVCAMITAQTEVECGDGAKCPSTIGWVFEIIGCIVCGISASYVWCAQGTYLTNVASLYDDAKFQETNAASSTGASVAKGASMAMFSGIFFCIFQMTSITGNLLASVLFQFAHASFFEICIVYLVFAVIGVVISFFIQPVDEATAELVARLKSEKDAESVDPSEEEEEEEETPLKTLLSAPKLLFGDLRMLLLVPLMVYSGFEMAFMWFDFFGNPVATHLGSKNVGYIAAILAAIDAVLSFILSNFAAKVAEIKVGAEKKPLGPVAFLPFVILGVGAHCVVTVLMFPGWNLLKIPFATDKLMKDWEGVSKYDQTDMSSYEASKWYGAPETEVNGTSVWAIFIGLSALWAAGDAVANTMLQNILGSYFEGWKTAAAFANLKVFQALATAGAAAFNYHGIIHAEVKSTVMLATYGVALLCYLAVVFFNPIVAKVSFLLCTVIFYANLAHSLTRSP
jgi:MFS family permease